MFIDPVGDISGLAGRGIKFECPPVAGVDADLLLITHEHADHNGAETIGGDPAVLRSTAGRLESPFGEVVAIASEHDAAAGTERGPNTIFVFGLDGIRIAHFGERLAPRWVVPMHYRTHRIGFLDPADGFLERMAHVHRLDETWFETESLPADGSPLVVVPAVP